jgi:hypothetical protein
MDPVAIDRLDDRVAVLERQCERLLDDDMFSGLGGQDGMGAMKLVRRGDVDRFDVRILANLPRVLECGCAEGARESVPWIALRVRRRNDPDTRVRSGGIHHDRARHPEADHAERNGRSEVERIVGVSQVHERPRAGLRIIYC